jgi:hypothetical protein
MRICHYSQGAEIFVLIVMNSLPFGGHLHVNKEYAHDTMGEVAEKVCEIHGVRISKNY